QRATVGYVDSTTDRVAKSSETVTVAANSAAVAEQKSGAGVGGGIASGTVPAASQAVEVQEQPLARAKTAIVAVNARSIVRWTIAADGALQRSFDNGQSWQAVALSEGKPFRVVASGGPVVWVGGSNAALFRSSDAGEHWTRIQPTVGQHSLTDDVTTIGLAGPANRVV